MGLAQNIVVKSRFSVPSGNGHGSRGGTPGDFILRYMSRGTAVENVTPTRVSESDSYLKRYADRAKAVEDSDSIPTIKRKMRNAQRRGGIAFGDGDVSLSDAKLKDISREVQTQFDNGKTAIETVVSFSEEYLRENGVLDPDFVHTTKGDFLGHIDQLKLRMAIMNGVDKLSHNFDDLHYVGVIQVDTHHVHCHLTMVDFGHGKIAVDGMQRGKLTALDIKNFRRGVDNFLDQKQTVRMMSSSVMYDRRNALCYIKKFTHQTMAQQGVPQFLLACLPENRNLWAANSNRQEMRKANAIVREFVMDILQSEGGQPSPMYRQSHNDIVRYADERQRREDLSDSERMKLIRNGEERMIRECMNGVYSVLKRIPREEMTVRTPMLEAMSMDYESMAAQAVNDPMMEFGFRLRSYSSRLKNHKQLYHKFRDEYAEYEQTEDKTEESKALGDHLALERDYQQMLMVKYQHFLTFMPPDEEFETEFEAVMKERDRLERMHKMQDDPTFQRVGNKEADDYGWRVYGIQRGSFIKAMPDVWNRRVEKEEERYAAMEKQFRDHLADNGLNFDGHGITRDKLFPFDEVKALDLHHLGYDFPYDVMISKKNVDRFVQFANRRYDSFMKAKRYLELTGQQEGLEDLLETDVMVMKQFADTLTQGAPSLKSIRPHDSKKHNGATIRLGKDYTMDMKTVVRSTVEATRTFE